MKGILSYFHYRIKCRPYPSLSLPKVFFNPVTSPATSLFPPFSLLRHKKWLPGKSDQLQESFQRSLMNPCRLLILWLSTLGCYQSFSRPSLPTPSFLLHLVLSSSCYFSSLLGTVLNWKNSAKTLGRSRPRGILPAAAVQRRQGLWADRHGREGRVRGLATVPGRAGFPGVWTALQGSAFSCQGQDYNFLLALAVARLGREARAGVGDGSKPARHPELGKLDRAQPRAWSTRSCRQAARVAGLAREPGVGKGLGTKRVALSTLAE